MQKAPAASEFVRLFPCPPSAADNRLFLPRSLLLALLCSFCETQICALHCEVSQRNSRSREEEEEARKTPVCRNCLRPSGKVDVLPVSAPLALTCPDRNASVSLTRPEETKKEDKLSLA